MHGLAYNQNTDVVGQGYSIIRLSVCRRVDTSDWAHIAVFQQVTDEQRNTVVLQSFLHQLRQKCVQK